MRENAPSTNHQRITDKLLAFLVLPCKNKSTRRTNKGKRKKGEVPRDQKLGEINEAGSLLQTSHFGIRPIQLGLPLRTFQCSRKPHEERKLFDRIKRLGLAAAARDSPPYCFNLR